MDYKWIQSFVVAAKSCNFRVAAEELHLSRQVFYSSYSSARTIFKREKNRVQLTEAGQLFLIEAQQSIKRFQLATKGIVLFHVIVYQLFNVY